MNQTFLFPETTAQLHRAMKGSVNQAFIQHIYKYKYSVGSKTILGSVRVDPANPTV